MNETDKPKTILRFGDCTLANLDKTFQLKQVWELAVLADWLARFSEISDFERQVLLIFQEGLKINVHDWNEQEISLHFIGPILSLVDFTTRKYNLFAKRSLAGRVKEVELGGEPNGMITSGFREPQIPYFYFWAYNPAFIFPDLVGKKKGEGDAAAQCLAAMLVAQTLNETQHPIYGSYIVGANWSFMVLQGREYAISQPYPATRDDIFDIFRILKGLKQIITELVSLSVGQ